MSFDQGTLTPALSRGERESERTKPGPDLCRYLIGMPIAIQELRPESLDDAVAFAKARGSHVGDGRTVAALSLVAIDGGELVAAALCVEQPGSRHRLEVGIAAPESHGDLHRGLIDKALMKLASAGVRKFDIRINGSKEQREFWQAVSWIDQTLGGRDEAAPAEPQASPAPPSGPIPPDAEPQQTVSAADERG